MRFILLPILILLLIFPLVYADKLHVVTKVVNGDIIIINDREKIRFIGINTLWNGQNFILKLSG